MSHHHQPIARKALGQHFLKNRKAIQVITEAVPAAVCAIEIGPGPGAITEPLLNRVKALTVIEKDDRFSEYWQQRASKTPALSVIHGDVLTNLEPAIVAIKPAWIVGNLPYNISGPLTAQLAGHALPGGMVLMYQREVGERIMADPGSKTYGGLSVLARHYYDVKRLITLPPGAFSPPPKVHSVVLLLTPHERSPVCTFKNLQKTVRTGFTHRRKTIANNFKGVLTPEGLTAIQIDPKSRPEQLDYNSWARLANAMMAIPDQKTPPSK